jgi:hypothetical protein
MRETRKGFCYQGWMTVDYAVTQIVTFLLSFGLPGVVIIVLGFAYYRKDQRVNDLQETLMEVSVNVTKAVEANTAAINGMRELIIMRMGKD